MLIENQSFVGTAGSDNCALVVGPQGRPITIINCIIDGSQADWGLKLSMSFDTVVEDCVLKDGRERALDMVRGGNVVFRRCKFVNTGVRKRTRSKWVLGKECDIGLKAGMRDVTFEDCEMNDLLLGDYSIYNQIDRPPVRRIKLVNCRNPNGGPIIIRGRYTVSNPVIAENTQVSMLVWPKIITAIYWWWNRRFGDKRKLSPEQSAITPEERV
jgi:hypothetical protein